jgi:alpha-galactosidase
MATTNTRDLAPEKAHTQTADNARGLPGAFDRPIKITMLGAGSAFTPRLLRDVLQIPGNRGGQIALVDVDAERLDTMKQVIELLIKSTDNNNWTVVGSTDRRDVLPGSHYVVSCVEVSGVACVAWDNDIPLKYGIDQCIGDTIGPGGLFKGLRTIPVFLDILRDMDELCPGAIMLNYTNPMNMMCLAAGRAVPQVPVVGLCHSVQGSSHQLAKRVGIAYEQMQWQCAGINHLAWFTELTHNGEDLYPRLMAQAEAEIYGKAADSDNANPEDVGHDLVRKDMMLHFGAFITESSGHLSEYLPYYRKSDAGRRYLLDNYEGGSRFYATEWPKWRKARDEERRAMLRGETPMDWERTWEYASWIIEAREKDVPWRIHGNVMNSVPGNSSKLIDNLPGDGCVEVACMIDRNGINPTRYGALPPQMAAICDSNMRMFDLGATAAIERSKEAAIHALTLDPLCAAVCTPRQIRDMAVEMFEAEADYLPGYN